MRFGSHEPRNIENGDDENHSSNAKKARGDKLTVGSTKDKGLVDWKGYRNYLQEARSASVLGHGGTPYTIQALEKKSTVRRKTKSAVRRKKIKKHKHRYPRTKRQSTKIS